MKSILPYYLVAALLLTSCGSEKPKSGKSSAVVPDKKETVTAPQPETVQSESTEPSSQEVEREQLIAEMDNVREARDEKTVRISRIIRGAAGMSITLDKLGGEDRVVPLKTQLINSEGAFELETTTKQWQIYDLRTDKGNIVLLLNGGNYEVEADINKLSEARVNSNESALIRRFYLLLEDFNRRYDGIRKREDRYTKNKKAWKVKRLLDSMHFYTGKIEKEKADAIMNFIEQNKNSIVAPIAAERLDFLKHTAFIQEVYENAKKLYPGSSYVKNIGSRLIRFRPMAIGQPAAEVILPNLDGENIRLSSLKGKHVLLYFSLNLYNESQAKMEELKSLYYQYNGKGFEVYNVICDESYDDWNAYLETLGAPWITVGDLQGQNSIVFEDYMATEFPMTFLINDEGIIVDKFVTMDRLKEYLRENL